MKMILAELPTKYNEIGIFHEVRTSKDIKDEFSVIIMGRILF